jgi:uncharacterized protein
LNPALIDLLALQDLDLAADRLRHRRDHRPERVEMDAVSAAMRSVEGDLALAERELKSVEVSEAEAEADLANYEGRAEAVERRLYSGEVSAARDLQAMAADLESVRARASHLEDRVLELLEEREPLEARVTSLAAELEGLSERRAGLEVALAASVHEVDDELAEVTGPRAGVAAKVPPTLVASYERLRGRLGGVGVARVVGSHCDGCHLTLSAMELEAIRHLRDDDVATCEQCSRILVLTAS